MILELDSMHGNLMPFLDDSPWCGPMLLFVQTRPNHKRFDNRFAQHFVGLCFRASWGLTIILYTIMVLVVCLSGVCREDGMHVEIDAGGARVLLVHVRAA